MERLAINLEGLIVKNYTVISSWMVGRIFRTIQAIEVVLENKILEGDMLQRSKSPDFDSHHGWDAPETS